MKMKKISMQNRAGAWYVSGLASIIMMLIMMGTPAFGQYSVTSPGAITITDESVIGTPAQASPYPSTISLPGPVPAGSTLEKVTVTLYGLSHGYANDIVAVLVGPNGNAVTLMGNSGNGQPVTNLVLTFDDNGSPPLALASPIPAAGGTFKPTNNVPDDDGKSYGSTTAVPGLSSATFFNTLAGAFGGLGANYTNNWSLYVIDTSQPNTGSISNWVLNLYTTPTVTGVNSNAFSFAENTQATITFTNTDVTSNATLTGAVSITTVTTSNPQNGGFSVFTNPASSGQFAFGSITPNGTGTLTLKPSPNTWGSVTFTFTIGDTKGNSTSFGPITATVTHVAQAPKLTVPASITTGNEVASASNNITMVSADGNGFGALTLTVSNPGQGNSQIGTTVFTNANGAGLSLANTNSVSLGVVPNGFPVASTNIVNLILTDTGDSLSVTQAVTVIVQPLTIGASAGPLVFTNTNSIVLGAASVVSSSITVPTLRGIGSNGTVSVSWIGLSNTVPAGLSAALISPGGAVVPLLFNPTAQAFTTNAEITFYDGTGPTAPVNPANTLPAGDGISTTNYVEKSFGSTLAPPQGFATLLGTTATNVWTLKVTNTSASASQIAGGWVLDLYPAPLVTFTNPSLTTVDSTPGKISITNNQIVVSSILEIPQAPPVVTVPVGLADNNSAVATQGVVSNSTVNVGGTNFTTYTITFTNNVNEFTTNGGAIPITVTSTDTNNLLGTATLPYIVTFVDQTPTISFISEQVAFAGTPILNVPFVVSSADTNAARLNINVSSGNQALLPTSAFQNNAVVSRGPSTGGFGTLAAGDPPFQPTIGGVTSPSLQTNYLSLYPVGIKGGQSQITVEVDDGTTTNTQQFLLFVQGPGSPLYYNATAISIPALNTVGSPYPSTNVVTGLVGTVENVVVTVFDVNEVQNAGAESYVGRAFRRSRSKPSGLSYG